MPKNEFIEFQAANATGTVHSLNTGENEFLWASHTPEIPYLSTLGIYCCKGITIHDPKQKPVY